jgi:hypothetical protein
MAQKFSQDFEIPENLSKEEKEDYLKMAYANFCVNIINSIKKNLSYLDMTVEVSGKKYQRFSIDLPYTGTPKKRCGIKERLQEIKKPNKSYLNARKTNDLK